MLYLIHTSRPWQDGDPILQIIKLRLREVNHLPKITYLVNGKACLAAQAF